MAKGNLMARRDVEISKAMSHALRHEPKAYALNLSDDGSVPLTDLAGALEATGLEVDSEDLRRVVAQSDKQRFALVGDRIRAQYGHSAGARIVTSLITPQPVLWHATSQEVVAAILREGLLPMGRQYAHLTTDRDLAMQAGRREAPRPVLLRIDAERAHRDGVEFWQGHDVVTLALRVPPRYITEVSGHRATS